MKSPPPLALKLITVLFSFGLLAAYVAFTHLTSSKKLSEKQAQQTDGYTIELQPTPEALEFEGFIIKSELDHSGTSKAIILGTKSISQPVFSVRKIKPGETTSDTDNYPISLDDYPHARALIQNMTFSVSASDQEQSIDDWNEQDHTIFSSSKSGLIDPLPFLHQAKKMITPPDVTKTPSSSTSKDSR